MTSGPNFPGVETASSKKDAVKKAFNQEYQATMKAMANAADRARAQVLNQKLAAGSHAQSSQSTKAAATAPNAPGTGNAPSTPIEPGAMVMIEIANELRRIIVAEIDMRMNHLAGQVEQAIAQSIPPVASNASSDAKPAAAQPAGSETGTAPQTPQPNIPATPQSNAQNPSAAAPPQPTPSPETAPSENTRPTAPQTANAGSENPPNAAPPADG
jgi:hypothetical protein